MQFQGIPAPRDYRVLELRDLGLGPRASGLGLRASALGNSI